MNIKFLNVNIISFREVISCCRLCIYIILEKYARKTYIQF